ncbi:hypothetical protein [Natronoglomus mannanivorans]|uniref:Voltage-gated potassium channel n=1 Tax=Natronoglomus mannanivorans TaxID=2979990 RepID=A0AAP2Z1U3_9EURY|nr:hypothetical protein [Halobacteria archaeon AArc-xg1-1]
MDAKRWWPPFAEIVALVWIVLFVVDVAIVVDVLAASESLTETMRTVLQWLLVVFLLDVALLYRWSEHGPRGFVRSNWFLVLTVVPWFRPLRLLRIGRSIRALRQLTGIRRVGSFVNKVRRKCHSLWHRL